MIRCNENQNYRVVVAFKRRSTAKIFAMELLDLHKATPIAGVAEICVTHGRNPIINFANGSSIEIIMLNHNNTGKRCNEVIYESEVDIEDERVRYFLQRMLVPYRCGEYDCDGGHPLIDNSRIADALGRHIRHKEVDQRSEELDEFLGSFSINENNGVTSNA